MAVARFVAVAAFPIAAAMVVSGSLRRGASEYESRGGRRDQLASEGGMPAKLWMGRRYGQEGQ